MGSFFYLNFFCYDFEKVLGRDKFYHNIERPKREKRLPEVISEKDLMKILKVTDNIKYKSIIVMLYSSGVRRGQLINLRLMYIDFDKKIIFVRTGKGKRPYHDISE